MKDKERRVLEVPKESCPQAVIDWYNLGHEKDNRSAFPEADLPKKARGHLSSIGWTFFYAQKNKRYELRYVSPAGKCHYSLRTACKTCIDEGRKVREKVSGCSRERSPRKTSAGESPGESSISTSNSAASEPVAKPRRKRSIDNDSVQCQSENHDNPGLHVGLKEEALIESSESIVTVDPNCKKKQRKCSVGNERVRKIPHIRGFSLHSTQNRKPSVLAHLIDHNVVELGAKVSYRGKQSTSGEVTRDGIKCHCCSVVFTLTAFESHVGSTNHRPAAFIVLEDGRSLADCKKQINIAGDRKRVLRDGHKGLENEDSEDCPGDNDEICSVCQYGGELLLCDRCPSAYHLNCLGYQTAPEGDWFCASCRCGVCGNRSFEEEAKDISDEHTVGNNADIVICHQCERKFHTGCLRKSGVNSDDQTVFCSEKCQTITLGLRNLVGKPIQVGSDSSLTWTLLKSKENDPKLSAALSVMHECFEPVKDPLTQRDMVEDVIFGRKSEVSRLNFKGFYVVVLERENEVMSVATVRIYGEKLAEMPLVATGLNYRRLGMCRVLLDELQNQLINLGVERLTLPSASVVLRTWVDSFGFSEMSVADKLEFLCYNLLDFQGTFMCQKLLPAKTASEGNISSPIVQDLPSESGIGDHCFSESGISVNTVEKFEDVDS